MTTILQVKKMHPTVQTPTKATAGSACFDIRAHISSDDNGTPVGEGARIAILPGKSHEVGTGLKVAVPAGYVMLLYSRSGHGAQFGVRLGNCVGVIDSDYRGELKAIMRNDSKEAFTLTHGDRCMQAMLIQLPDTNVEVVEELDETERGEGGLGSTGND